MDISVIIPTYNRAATIVNSIESVLNQTYPISEIIVVDDGSSDNTEELVSNIGDDRIRYCRQDSNKGAGAARNKGVSIARYDIIAFNDSDDIWRPDKIKKQIGYKEEHRDYRLVYSAYVRHYSDSDQTMPDPNGREKLEGRILPEILYKNSVGTPTALMEKSLFEDIGGFDEELRCLEDWDLFIRASKETSIGYVPEVLVDAGYMEDGVTSDFNEYFKSRCRMMQKYREDYLNTDTFNKSVESILGLAYNNNMFEQVKDMLLHYIST